MNVIQHYMPKTSESLFRLVISILIPLAIGYSASLLTLPNIPTWYVFLEKPLLTPPNWIFAPVWTTLYVLMGISCYLIWSQPQSKQRRQALTVYAVQMVFNFLWSLFFFEMQMPLLAFMNIILLWVSILTTIRVFMPLNRYAAWMHIPTLLWVSFAAYLNFGVWWLN